jgi:hypothetical protein
MPVLRVRHGRPGGERSAYLGVHGRDYRIAAAYAQAPSRIGEVILEIHDDQGHERVVAGSRIVGRPGTVLRRSPTD